MIDPDKDFLLKDCKKLVSALATDMREAIDRDSGAKEKVETEFQRASTAGRTGLSRIDWETGWLTQGAVAWVLGCVFIRFCEDNDLVDEPMLSGTGARLALAKDQRSAYLQANPLHDDRQWLLHTFDRYARIPGTKDIFGKPNPVWALSPSADGARTLSEFWWKLAAERNDIVHDFADDSFDTRFLGDLYQDLSDHAKKAFALLQTPIFVEEFILDRTLDPAIATFGLSEVRLIDPTCGSGHFLLGAFNRLVARWREAEPGTSNREIARRALDAVYGVDLNPFAAAIARFRLLVSALKVSGDMKLIGAPEFKIHIAVGDSLLHGEVEHRMEQLLGDDEAIASAHGYSTEDVAEARRILTQQYHAVVGNPPYITVKDKALNDLYRVRFKTCHRQYSLGVPFTEKFWNLAISGDGIDKTAAGFVGLITANSFMKREFGKKLVEQWLPHRDLTHMLDTSGAYIPGHGTPTVILFGRNRLPVGDSVRAVMGIRGEPSRPDDASKGIVWTSMTDLIDHPGDQNAYVSAVDLPRAQLAKHPWSIGGKDAISLKALLDGSSKTIEEVAALIGYSGQTNGDDAFLRPEKAWKRFGLTTSLHRQVVVGDIVRDWQVASSDHSWFPYRVESGLIDETSLGSNLRLLWPYRTPLWNRATFAKTTYRDEGRTWWEWHQMALKRLQTPLSIVFAFVATHNHFVLDRGGKVFKQSAPVIKLPAGSTEDDHLALLALLNSSTACFWMKQVFHGKGNGGVNEGLRGDEWEEFFEFDGTKIKAFPLPSSSAIEYGNLLDSLAVELAALSPRSICETGAPSRSILDDAHNCYDNLRAQMICAQEESDWHAYRLYGLIDEDLTFPLDHLMGSALGERAFEIVLARLVADGDEETTWFERHGSTPLIELPVHWAEDYRALVQRRIDAIGSIPEIALIEKPEYKRRWNTDSWEVQEQAALRSWLLDRLETDRYWDAPDLTTVGILAGQARQDAEFVQVAALFQKTDDPDLVGLLNELMRKEAVPYLAALRFTEDGLRKHEEWLRVWELQRQEDRTGETLAIDVPPKYTNKDFVGAAWAHRGKLDVPKERFVSYPGAEREGDGSLVVGWSGWDHLERARALASWFVEAESAGRDPETVLWPMLAGLHELLPWLVQWHNEPNDELGGERAGDWFRSFIDTSARRHGTTPADLVNVRPIAARKPRASNKTAATRKKS
jgi:SAM-dependent methyltransferase